MEVLVLDELLCLFFYTSSEVIKLNISVKVREKIASAIDENSVIICGNSDYVIEFDFDNEWDKYSTKTARFSVGAEYVDVVFTGNKCSVPILRNVFFVKVGVFAGDLVTSTPAIIPCKKSIICDPGVAVEPPKEYGEVAYRDLSNVNEGIVLQKVVEDGLIDYILENLPSSEEVGY